MTKFKEGMASAPAGIVAEGTNDKNAAQNNPNGKGMRKTVGYDNNTAAALKKMIGLNINNNNQGAAGIEKNLSNSQNNHSS